MNPSLQQQFLLKPSVIAVSAILALSALPAYSADADEPARIKRITVVGQATDGVDSVVDQDALDKAEANDLADVFRADPSVSAGGSVKMGQKIYVRDIGEDSLNITVDGAEQAGAVFHHSGRIALEPELLKRVEVEAGTGSATAGPGALGGAVRFITKDPEDLLEPGKNVGVLLKSTYFDNGDGFKNTATVYGQGDSGVLSGMVSVTGSDLDNLDDGNGDEIAGTESEQDLAYVKVVANISDEQYLSISHEKLEEEGMILYRPELILSARNAVSPTTGDRNTTILNYGFSSDNPLLDLEVDLYTTEQEQERAFRGTFYDGGVETVGLNLKNTSRTDKQTLIYGINYRDDKSFLNDIDFPANPYFEETGEVVGVFVQDIIELNDQWELSAGVRFDDYELKDANGLEFNDDGASGNIGVRYQMREGIRVNAGYAEALRGPEVEDSFRLSSYSNDANLKAEEAKTVELGVDFYGENYNVELGVYQTNIENPIGRNPPWSRVVTNLEHDIEAEGYFVNYGYSWEKLELGARFLSSESESNGQPVTRYVYGSTAASKGDTLVLDINYDLNDSFEAGWTSEIVSGIDNIRLQVGGDNLVIDKPGYSVHDLYASWRPFANDDLKVTLAIKNLFDKNYLSHSSVEDFRNNAGYEIIAGSPEAGRDIRLSVAARF